MAAIVFVWKENVLKGNPTPGHASLFIQGKAYISFYPDPRHHIEDAIWKGSPPVLNVPRRHGVGGRGAGPGIVMSVSMDIDTHHFTRPADFASAPIVGLDEGKMVEWWRKHRTDKYSLIRNSCAHMVVRTLEAGGAADKSIAAKAIILASKASYVLPSDCIYLAKALAINRN